MERTVVIDSEVDLKTVDPETGLLAKHQLDSVRWWTESLVHEKACYCNHTSRKGAVYEREVVVAERCAVFIVVVVPVRAGLSFSVSKCIFCHCFKRAAEPENINHTRFTVCHCVTPHAKRDLENSDGRFVILAQIYPYPEIVVAIGAFQTMIFPGYF